MPDLSALQDYIGVLSPNKGAELKRLGTWHKQAILLHLNGVPLSDIAQALGKSSSSVSNILRSELGQNLINDYLSFCDQEFKVLYQLSISAIRDALSCDDLEMRLKAADKYLKAHGKYQTSDTGRDTAEDIISRIMELNISKGEQGQVQLKVEERRLLKEKPDESNEVG